MYIRLYFLANIHFLYNKYSILILERRAAEELTEKGSGRNLIGWDVCLTPDGPVIVEGNDYPGHDLYQLPEHTHDKMGIWPKYQF